MATPPKYGFDRIISPPGTDEHNRQFRRQSLRAADAALALWIVRIPCGLFALVTVASLVDLWLGAIVVNVSLIAVTVYLSALALELGDVALRGKSFYLRFVLSGARVGHVEVNDGDEAK